MTLVLHDHPISSNALKVRFLLAELGLEYARAEVPLSRPRPAEYVALNPLAGIPALRDGDFVLTESHAILRYLAAREGRDDLLGTDLRERAQVDELLDRWATRLRPAFFRHEMPALGYKHGVGFGGAPPDPERAAAVAVEIHDDLALTEQLLGPDFAVLGRLTIADCAIAPVLFRTTKSGLDLGPFPTLRALRDALLARPAFAAAGPVT